MALTFSDRCALMNAIEQHLEAQPRVQAAALSVFKHARPTLIERLAGSATFADAAEIVMNVFKGYFAPLYGSQTQKKYEAECSARKRVAELLKTLNLSDWNLA